MPAHAFANPRTSPATAGKQPSAETLRTQYVVTLGLVACLTISNQALLRESLEVQRRETAVGDYFDRAILSTERLAKAALEAESAAVNKERRAHRVQLVETLDHFSGAYRDLPSDLELAGAPSETIAALLVVEPHFRSACDTFQELVRLLEDRSSPRPDLVTLHRLTGQAVVQANKVADETSRIVAEYRHDMGARKSTLNWIGILVLSMTLIVLLAQASLIVHRAMRMLRRFFDKENEWSETVQTVQSAADRQRIRNELILNSTAEGICGVDLEGKITFANTATTVASEWELTDLLGSNLHDVLRHSQMDGSPYPRETCPLCLAIDAGRSCRAKNERFWKRDGTSFPVEYTSTPIHEDGARIGAVVTFRDITAENLLQSQLLQAHKLEAIGQLAAGIAHEINTPIQYVGDNTRFLQDAFESLCRAATNRCGALAAVAHDAATGDSVPEAEPITQDDDLDYLLQEVPTAICQSLEGIERVAKIVRAMKEFSHPSTGKRAAIDLHRAIENTVTIARNEWKYVSTVDTDFDPSIPLVICLPDELNQALLNILVNAAHAIAEATGNGAKGKGTITVSTRRDGEWVEIRICDTGAGIPERYRHKVFEPFFTTKPVGKGTGQGLAVAYAVVVDQHGGTIDFETEVGRGTTFVIRLPLAAKPLTEGVRHVEEACPVC
jgi:PAS domain S-box-containing protein